MTSVDICIGRGSLVLCVVRITGYDNVLMGFVLFCSAGYETQSLTHAEQGLYH